MRESIKVLCVFALMVGALTSVVVWVLDQPGPIVWTLRFGAPLLAVAGLGWFLRMHFQPGKAPDYLSAVYGRYFYKDGFAFAFGPIEVRRGTAWLEVGFQNQHAEPCLARITLRPARNFFLQRASIPPLRIEVRAEGGAFGVAQAPFPLPPLAQGKSQTFDVGASAVYSQGRGELLRYRNWDGVADDDQFGGQLPLAGELVAAVLTQKSHQPTTVKLDLPTGAYETLPADAVPRLVTLWRWGDDPEQSAAAILKRFEL